jgi:hypothetical protein
VQPVGDHQLDLCLSAGGNHPPALVDRHGHRLFAQHMDAGARRANRVLGVHRVRQGEVDGVNRPQAFVELVVVERVLEPIALRDVPPLRTVAADDSRQPRVSSRMRECGKHGNLGDVAQPDDGVADGSFRC